MRPLKRSTIPLVCGWAVVPAVVRQTGLCRRRRRHACRWLLVFVGEAVGILRAVVGQNLADSDGGSQLEVPKEINAAFLGHIAVYVHEYPARCTVDCDKQIAAGGLVRHLWQVLDVDVDEATFVVPGGLLRRDLFSLGRRNQAGQARHALTL